MLSEGEIRSTPTGRIKVVTRADGKRVLVGYGAVFYRSADPGTQYQLWPGCKERISPTAFNRALSDKQDVICDFNHDEGLMLGRTASGTCRLSVDAVGLKYEVDLPSVTNPINLAELIERGDISGSSFAFKATGVVWTTEGFGDDKIEVRTIIDCDLFDVGPVGRPAYQSTTAALREGTVLTDNLRVRQIAADDVAVKLRLLDIEESHCRDVAAAKVNAAMSRLARR